MDSVGRMNPLSQYLAGREVAIGDTLQLPKEIADQVFNLGENFGQVERFDLTLEKISPPENSATFFARVEAASNDASQMRLQVDGPVVVDIGSSRAVETSLAGPIGMSETRGSFSTSYQVIGTGRLQMRIASRFQDVKH
jgi:hypothetical protein